MGRIPMSFRRYLTGSVLTAAVIVGGGILLRWLPYSAGQSLWLDESYVAVDIVGRSWKEIVCSQSLFPQQPVAPLGFNLAVKLFVTLLGNNEFTLRLYSFLAGILSLFLYFRLVKRYLSPPAALAALGMMAFSGALLYYSSELKPYAGDVLVTVILFLLAWESGVRVDRRSQGSLIIVGGLALWFSHASLFVLAGLWTALAFGAWRGKDSGARPFLIKSAGFWLANFSMIFKLALEPMGNNDYLLGTWREYFIPQQGGGLPQVMWWGRSILEYAQYPFGGGVLAAGVFFILILLGAISIYRRQKDLFERLFFPFAFVALAVVSRKYPLHGRILLFTLPLLFMYAAEGFGQIIRRFPRARLVTAPFVILVLIFPSVARGYVPINREGRPDNRSVLMHLRQSYRSGDLLLMNISAQFPFWYYSGMFDLRQLPGLVQNESWDGDPRGRVVIRFADGMSGDSSGKILLFRETVPLYTREGYFRGMLFGEHIFDVSQDGLLPYYGRAWIFLSHIPGSARKEVLRLLDHNGRRLDTFERPGAAVYLYDLSGSPAGRVGSER